MCLSFKLLKTNEEHGVVRGKWVELLKYKTRCKQILMHTYRENLEVCEFGSMWNWSWSVEIENSNQGF